MHRTLRLPLEHSRVTDLWTLLSDAEQIVINHDYLHPRMYQRLTDLMQIVETYQTAVEHQLEQQEFEP